MALNLSQLDGTDGFRLDGADAYDLSGVSVSGAGDVNGDGIDDLIVGAPNANGGAGASYVVFGTGTPFAASLDLAALDGSDGFRLDGTAEYDRSGQSVSAAGDVNGDGIDDLIIGAPGTYFSPSPVGVVFGTDAPFAASLDLAALDGSDGFRLDGDTTAFPYYGTGWSVSGAGDVNGDGIDDLIVGAPNANGGAGASYVVFGTGTPFAASLDLTALDGSDGFRLDGADAYDLSGVSVSGAGDVNGDGIDDLIVGAPYANGGAGASYVVFGTDAPFAASLDLAALDGSDGFRLDGTAEYDRSGRSVSAAGDVNGDGIDDLIIGAPGNYFSPGASYVVFGTDAPFAASLDLAALDGIDGFRLDGNTIDFPYDGTGYSVSGAGDVNGDGIDDLIVGAPNADGYSGTSYVVFGTDAGFTASLDLTALDGSDGFRLDGAASFNGSGASVSGAGDVNGDGLNDLIVGAPYVDTAGGYYAGASYVVFGFRTCAANTAEASVTASPDDAEQVGTRTKLASKDLDIGCGLVGLRFSGLEVPDGATIIGAHIEFQARQAGGGAAEITVAVEDTTDAAGFDASDVAGRDYLDATTAWAPEAWVKGETYSTPDLGATLAALFGTGGIDAEDACAFRFAGTGERTAWSYDGQGEAPRLVVDYELADGPLETAEAHVATSPPDSDPQVADFLFAWGEPALA